MLAGQQSLSDNPSHEYSKATPLHPSSSYERYQIYINTQSYRSLACGQTTCHSKTSIPTRVTHKLHVKICHRDNAVTIVTTQAPVRQQTKQKPRAYHPIQLRCKNIQKIISMFHRLMAFLIFCHRPILTSSKT